MKYIFITNIFVIINQINFNRSVCVFISVYVCTCLYTYSEWLCTYSTCMCMCGHPHTILMFIDYCTFLYLYLLYDLDQPLRWPRKIYHNVCIYIHCSQHLYIVTHKYTFNNTTGIHTYIRMLYIIHACMYLCSQSSIQVNKLNFAHLWLYYLFI